MGVIDNDANTPDRGNGQHIDACDDCPAARCTFY